MHDQIKRAGGQQSHLTIDRAGFRCSKIQPKCQRAHWNPFKNVPKRMMMMEKTRSGASLVIAALWMIVAVLWASSTLALAEHSVSDEAITTSFSYGVDMVSVGTADC
jgi:hypothetical protein